MGIAYNSKIMNLRAHKLLLLSILTPSQQLLHKWTCNNNSVVGFPKLYRIVKFTTLWSQTDVHIYWWKFLRIFPSVEMFPGVETYRFSAWSTPLYFLSLHQSRVIWVWGRCGKQRFPRGNGAARKDSLHLPQTEVWRMTGEQPPPLCSQCPVGEEAGSSSGHTLPFPNLGTSDWEVGGEQEAAAPPLYPEWREQCIKTPHLPLRPETWTWGAGRGLYLTALILSWTSLHKHSLLQEML